MRQRLEGRRLVTTVEFDHARTSGDKASHYILSIGRFPDGRPAELFLNTAMRLGSDVDINIADAAVAVSIALQHGVPADDLRAAMKRNPDGTPQGPLGAALDILCQGDI